MNKTLKEVIIAIAVIGGIFFGAMFLAGAIQRGLS